MGGKQIAQNQPYVDIDLKFVETQHTQSRLYVDVEVKSTAVDL